MNCPSPHNEQLGRYADVLAVREPELDAAEPFGHDFGYRSETELHLRGTLPGPQ